MLGFADTGLKARLIVKTMKTAAVAYCPRQCLPALVINKCQLSMSQFKEKVNNSTVNVVSSKMTSIV